MKNTNKFSFLCSAAFLVAISLAKASSAATCLGEQVNFCGDVGSLIPCRSYFAWYEEKKAFYQCTTNGLKNFTIHCRAREEPCQPLGEITRARSLPDMTKE